MFYSKIGRRWFCYITIFCLLLFTTIVAQAQLPSTVDETSIAATYNNVAGQTGWGVLGAVPFSKGKIKGHAAVVTQSSTALTRAKYHAEIGTSFAGWDFNFYFNGLAKKYAGSDTGRVNGTGIAVEAPERDIGSFHFTGGIGIEGANAGQIGAPNAGDTLEPLGYDPEKMEELGLYSFNPAPTGLTIDQRNALKGLLYAELSHPSGITITLKGLPELLSDNEDPIHQLIVSGSTSVEVKDNVSVEIGVDLGLQTYKDTIERELATLIAAKLSF